MLSPSFLAFDQARAAAAVWPRGHLLIDRQAARTAGTEVFEFAREFVEGRGYQLSLCGIDIYALARLQLGALGFTYQVVEWNETDASLTTRAERAAMAEMLTSSNAAKTILTGCSSDEAIAFGQEIGIQLFAGQAASAALSRAELDFD